MELYKKILAEYYAELDCPDAVIDGAEIVRDRCYHALCQIRQILADDTLDDPECFQKIEAVVSILEELELDAGNRHDFG